MARMRITLATLAAALGLFCCALSAFGDQVTPNERVNSRLKIRAEPSTDAEVLGYLKQGETLPLLGTTRSWRQVKLGEKDAYVSSSYTRVTADSRPAVYSIRLGSWNMMKLGHGATKDYARLAKVVEEHFDILAVVEVMQEQQRYPGYEALMKELGSGWGGQITNSPRPNTPDSNSEFYAIVYRSSAVHPCAGWTGLKYHQDNDGRPGSSGANDFRREPAFGCFAYGPVEKPTGDFLLAAYHAVYDEGNAAVINAEVKHVVDVFASMKAARQGEKDLLIAGDFNRKPSQIASLLPGVADKTEGSASTLNQSGDFSKNLYDHLLVYDQAGTQEIQGNAKVLDVRDVAASPSEFRRTVSDHLPIMVILTSAEDDD